MADRVASLGASLGRGFSGIGNTVGKNIADRRLGKELNPMREALLASQPASGYTGPMASQEAMAAQQARTPEQQMLMAAAQDPTQFAKLAGSQAGALTLGGVMAPPKQEPRVREIVVHPEDALNTKLGLGLKDKESVIVKLNYDQQDRQTPGFTLSGFKSTQDNTAGRMQYPGGPVGRVLLTNDIRTAHGMPTLTPEETDRIFNEAQYTSADQQNYRRYYNQQLAAGVPESQIMDSTDYKMTNAAGVTFSTGIGKDEAGRMKEYQDQAVAAIPALKSIETGYGLIDKGLIAGAGSEPRLALVRAIDTVLGREGPTNASAATDAYMAASGVRVGEAIKAFGAGTGLSDADRDFARLIVGGKIEMSPTALRMALEILARGKLGEVSRYKNQRDNLQGDFALMKPFMQDVQVPDSIYARISPLSKAPEGASDDEKLKFYLNQRPSYLPQGANQQLPPNGGSGPVQRTPPGPNATPDEILQFYRQQR